MRRYEESPITFSTQKKVGYAGAAGSLLISLVNVSIGIFVRNFSLLETLAKPAVYILFCIAVISYITTTRDIVFFRYMHVAVFFIYGLVATFIYPTGDLTGVLFGVYGTILSIQYRLMRKHVLMKLIVIVFLFGVAAITSAIFIGNSSFPSGLPTAILVSTFIYLYWVVFAGEIRAYAAQNKYLSEERDKNKVFVKFGRNIAGVIHNLKSILMSVDGYIDLIKISKDDNLKDLLELQKKSTKRMATMISNFMTAVRSYQRAEPQQIRLNQLVASAIEVLKGNDILKHKIRINMDLREPDAIHAVPMEIMQIVDNLVTNAAESMVDTGRFDITIKTWHSPRGVHLQVIDQGNGIPVCSECDNRDCMSCRSFSIGKTSKKEGTGIGIVYVREIMKEIGGSFEFDSLLTKGTTVSLTFPSSAETGNDAA